MVDEERQSFIPFFFVLSVFTHIHGIVIFVSEIPDVYLKRKLQGFESDFPEYIVARKHLLFSEACEKKL